MYTPSKKILQKYASLMVNFGLGKTKGVKKGDVVRLLYEETSKPLAIEIYKELLKKGAHPVVKRYDDEFSKELYLLGNKEQLTFFPKKYSKSLVDTIDHSLAVIVNKDPHIFKNVDPKKMFESVQARKPIRDWMNEKENKGKYTWTLCRYPTEGMAKEAGLSLKEAWEQVIKACYLKSDNPIEEWKKTYKEMNKVMSKLNSMPIKDIKVKSKNVDLKISLGDKRKFIGGRGANIPSFEIFTSPDWRGTEGFIEFDMPLYRYGNIVEGIRLEFKKGKVVKATASKNEKILKELVKTKGADQVGEFSLTDKRFSKIDKFMADTLFDENFGGKYGNTHIALGKSYHDTYSGDVKSVKKDVWEKLGFNDSAEHVDMISTEDRVVTAVLHDGTEKVIYEKGSFLFK